MRANPEIDALLAELLESGVSPKYVSRLASELDDHYADLEEEAKRLGITDGDAAADAKQRLGRCSHIAEEFERRPELKSWVYTSRSLERVLRLLGIAYLLLRAPARVLAAGQGVMLRYTAAAAAGGSVTFAILLMLTTMMQPNSVWGIQIVERAGAALGAWRIERPQRISPELGTTAPEEPAAEGETEAANAPGADTAAARGSFAPGASASAEPEDVIDLERQTIARRSVPRFGPPEWRVSDHLAPSKRPVFDRSKARVVLAELEPSIHLGIDDRDFKPVIEARPTYPLVAAQRGLEGRVVLEYTVTRSGAVRDPVVVESSHPVFNRAALETAREFKYEPRVIRGQPVDVRGVRIVIRFELEA